MGSSSPRTGIHFDAVLAGAHLAPRLTTAECRKILGKDFSITDDRLDRLRDELYALAELVTERFSATAPLPDPSPLARFDSALALLPDAERADVAERAAIMQFDGGVSADEAERAAVVAVIRRKVRNGQQR